jgi:hypothetical protein
MNTKAAEAVREAAERVKEKARRLVDSYEHMIAMMPFLATGDDDVVKAGYEVALNYLAILADPASLLPSPQWEEYDCGRWEEHRWKTIAGVYQAVISDDKWEWAILGKFGPFTAPSLEAAQAAAFADYRERVRGMFRR